MNTKSIFQRAVFTSITIALILTFTIGKINNTNVLDLFDGVLNTEASSGNISPSHVCSTSQYQQFTNTSTANTILLSTPLDTNISFDLPMIQNSFSPSLQATETIDNLCIQSLPNFGSLYQGATLFNPSTPTSFYGNFDHAFAPQAGSYRPPVGFVGLACFSYFVTYESPAILALTGNRPYNTNVAQMRIQVGGSTRTTCGADGSVTTSATINGKIFNDLNKSGIQENFESDYSVTSPYPTGTTVAITETTSPSNTFTITPNPNGTYSQILIPGQYSVTVNTPVNYALSLSQDLGTGGNLGANPTLVTVLANETKSAGKDGVYAKHQVTGSIYPDFNNNGIQDIGESYSSSNPYPASTTVQVSCYYPALQTFNYTPTIDSNGNYTQQVEDFNISGTACNITITPPSSYSITNSSDLGDGGIGYNPTSIPMPSGAFSKSQGKDGLYEIPNFGTVTGKIYNDLNNNGFQDTNEPDYSTSSPSPINTVRIINIMTSDLFDTSVNTDGTYSQVVPVGDYIVAVYAPALYSFSDSTELGNGTGANPTSLTIGAGETKSAGKDGIVTTTSAIFGKIYSDINFNGIQDVDEPDYSSTNPYPVGTKVYIFSCGNDDLSEIQLNTDGTYYALIPYFTINSFHCISIQTPYGYELNESLEVGDGIYSNRMFQFTSPFNQVKNNGKDGIYPTQASGAITGKVYGDLNQNGYQDFNEPDYNITDNIIPFGTTVTFTNPNDSSFSLSIFPDPFGSYIVELPTTGYTPYIVTVTTNQNYIVTQSNEIGLSSNTGGNPTRILGVSPDTSYDAGKDGLYQIPTTGTITGKIYNVLSVDYVQGSDEPDYNSTNNPIPTGTLITFTDLNNINNEFTISPDSDGTYSQQLPAGQYSVNITTNIFYLIELSNELGDLSNSGSNPTIVTISGGETKSAGNDGLFNGVLPPTTGTITGKIYNDLNQNGVQDINEPDYSASNTYPVDYIYIIDYSRGISYYPVLNTDGTYSQVVVPGTYTIEVNPLINYAISNSTDLGNGTGSNPTTLTVANGENKSAGKDGIYKLPTGTVTGKIYPDLNGNGIQDTNEPDYSTSNPAPPDTYHYILNTTSPNIYYPILINPNGTFAQDIIPGEYNFYIDSSEGISVSQSDLSGNLIQKYINGGINFIISSNSTLFLGNFGLNSQPEFEQGIVSGYVYEDTNNNGIKDIGENGIEGVNIKITSSFFGSISESFVVTNTEGRYFFQNSRARYVIKVNEIQPNNYIDGSETPGPFAILGSNDEINFNNASWSVNNNFGEIPRVQSTSTGGQTITITQDNSKSTTIQDNVNKQNIQSLTSQSEQKAGDKIISLAINQEFDLNDPYVCGSYVYGYVISSPSIIAELNIEFSQEGKIVKTYNLKSNTDGTWKQLLDDLAYGKYSYKVVASYQELTDSESFEIQHKSLKECQNVDELSNVSANEISKGSKEIVLARTGGLSARFNSPFIAFALILVLAFVMSIFRNLNYLKALFLYSFLFVSYLYSR